MKIKGILKIVLLLGFLYIAFFSITNFYQGYHDVDTSYNFLNSGTYDLNSDGRMYNLNDIYLRGVDRMTYSFVWLCLDCLVAVLIGYLWRKNE